MTVIPLTQLFALNLRTHVGVAAVADGFGGTIDAHARSGRGDGVCGNFDHHPPMGIWDQLWCDNGRLIGRAFAWTTLMTKKLTRTETVTCVLFYLTVMQAVFGVICAGYDGDIAVPSITALPYVW